MASVPQTPQECENFLLSTLPDEDYLSLMPHLERVPNPLHAVLYERGKRMQYAYFPLTGQHSILAGMKDGTTVEIGTVGFEGFTSVDLLTGGEIASETTVCEVPGDSLRMRADTFKLLLSTNQALSRITLRYMQAYLSQVSQSVACNALHSIDQRFTRWVLMCHIRARRKPFHLTQEYLASMLGVQRSSVSLTAKQYQDAGMIRYNRGQLTVLDYEGLEKATCECYHTVKDLFEKLLGKRIA